MKFGIRVTLAIGAAALVSLAAGLINAASLAGFGASMDSLAGERFAESRQANAAKAHVQSIQSGILRALLTADASTLKPATEALDREADAFYDNLAALATAGSARKVELDAIREDFQRYYLYAQSILGQEAGPLDDPAVLARFSLLESSLVGVIDSALLGFSEDFASGLSEIRAEATRARNLSIVMLLSVAVFSAVYAMLLSRSLSRPIRTLAASAERFGHGDFSVRSDWTSRDEFGTLSSTFNTMADGIASLTSGLERKVQERTAELESANASLDAALAELRSSEARILLSEKMAALGRLSAGVAHEVNTPLAAILSSRHELEYLFSGAGTEASLLDRYATLGPRGRFLFGRLVSSFEASFDLSDLPDSRETRAARREAAKVLSEAGLEDAAVLASTLADLLALGLAREVAPLLAEAEGRAALELAAAWCQGQRSARIIGAAAEKTATVVKTLRFYAEGGDDSAPGVFDLGMQLAGVVTQFRDAERKGTVFVVDLPEGLRALGRPEELGRVWVNLVSNAVHAIQSRGRVELRGRPVGGSVEVSVSDNGPGIPEAIRGRIFQPFVTTKRAGEGAGLGLEISKRLVEANGGSITFTSGPEGTVFTVLLPAAPAGA